MYASTLYEVYLYECVICLVRVCHLGLGQGWSSERSFWSFWNPAFPAVLLFVLRPAAPGNTIALGHLCIAYDTAV